METRKSELHDKAFTINAASIFMYKSHRKNSVCSDIISVNHLINHEEVRKITDERILQQFAETVEKIVYQSLKYNRYLELTVYVDTGKNSSNKNIQAWEHIRYEWHRVQFDNIENCVRFLYNIYCLIYPYNELDFDRIVAQDNFVRYFIKKWNGNQLK